MMDTTQYRDAIKLIRDGWSDEDVERLTRVSLLEIIGVRARAASEPARISPAFQRCRPTEPMFVNVSAHLDV